MNKGFSLIELLVVIAIVGTLATIAAMQFGRSSRKSAVENQTRLLYADLMTVRSQAMYARQPRSIILTSSAYAVYSSSEVSVTPVFTKALKQPISWNGADGQIDFDASGLLSNPGAGGRSICITDDTNEASVDSIVLSMTRTQIGKRVEGGSCAAGNIKTK